MSLVTKSLEPASLKAVNLEKLEDCQVVVGRLLSY